MDAILKNYKLSKLSEEINRVSEQISSSAKTKRVD